MHQNSKRDASRVQFCCWGASSWRLCSCLWCGAVPPADVGLPGARSPPRCIPAVLHVHACAYARTHACIKNGASLATAVGISSPARRHGGGMREERAAGTAGSHAAAACGGEGLRAVCAACCAGAPCSATRRARQQLASAGVRPVGGSAQPTHPDPSPRCCQSPSERPDWRPVRGLLAPPAGRAAAASMPGSVAVHACTTQLCKTLPSECSRLCRAASVLGGVEDGVGVANAGGHHDRGGGHLLGLLAPVFVLAVRGESRSSGLLSILNHETCCHRCGS